MLAPIRRACTAYPDELQPHVSDAFVTPCVSAFVATSTGCTLTGSSSSGSVSTAAQDDKARALAVLAAAASADDHEEVEPRDDSSSSSSSSRSSSSSSTKGKRAAVRKHGAARGDSSFTYALIARRSCERCGTRFLRGADTKGRVANFAETEQIVAKESCDDDDDGGGIEGLSAHVQVLTYNTAFCYAPNY